MNDREFQRESARADEHTRVDSPNAQYWQAYQRGLRRSRFGEGFGTQVLHARWLAMADSRDTLQAARGRGYREGLAACAPEPGPSAGNESGAYAAPARTASKSRHAAGRIPS